MLDADTKSCIDAARNIFFKYAYLTTTQKNCAHS